MAGVVFTGKGTGELGGFTFGASSYAGNYFLLDLFSNLYAPTVDSEPSDFMIASFAGYSQVGLNRSNFESTWSESDGYATATYLQNPLGWVNGGTINAIVYGYLVTSAVTGNVLFSEAFAESAIIEPRRTLHLNVTLFLFP